LVIIVVVATLIIPGFLLFGRLRSRALDDKADTATTGLRSAWRGTDLGELRDAYNQAAVDANGSGDFLGTGEAVPSFDGCNVRVG